MNIKIFQNYFTNTFDLFINGKYICKVKHMNDIIEEIKRYYEKERIEQLGLK